MLGKLFAKAALRLRDLAWGHEIAGWKSQMPSCGKQVRLRMPLKIYDAQKLSLGDQVDIGEFTLIRASGGVTIGDRVLIAAHAVIASRTHPKELPRFGVNIDKPIVIEDDVWIGTGAIILPGVTVKKGAVIGAGAVVTKDVEAFQVVAGVPAKELSNKGESV